MITKRLFFLVALVISFQLGLISCGGDNDTPLPPGKAVSQIQFTDTDVRANLIAGKVSWTLPDPETNIDRYVLYLGESVTDKKTKLGEAKAGATSFDIPEETAYLPYLLIVAANSAGESSAIAHLSITDLIPGIDPEPVKENGIYVLNSGTQGGNNATLDYFSFELGIHSTDIFEKANNRKLGSLANDMIIYGSKIYIAVDNSKTIEVTDLKAKSLKTIKTEGNPRYLLGYGGSVYATLMNGKLVRVDTTDLDVILTLPVGRNPEQLAAARDTIYVANSGGMDYNTPLGYDTTISVVDPATFKEIRKIPVHADPLNIQTDNAGNIYVASMGDYTTPPVLQKITTSSGAVSVIPDAHPSEMASEGGKIYMFYAGYDANWAPLPLVYGTYDVSSGKYTAESWLKDNLPPKPYKIFANRDLPHLYYTSGDYSSNGEVYVYMGGTFINKYETSGIYPLKVCFISEK
jgi:hypothetical protein